MSITENILSIKKDLPANVTLIAVSKTRTNEEIMEAYRAGQRDFGENKVQELLPKAEALPKDIRWHLIGHLQSNKVKFITPFVHLIHSVDSEKLLAEIDKQAAKCGRKISVLLQIFIAKEETKFGFSFEEATALLNSEPGKKYPNVEINGLMGMATNTENQEQIRSEFKLLNNFYTNISRPMSHISCLSMGMSSDWKIAIEEGSTMIRVGSSIFGERIYHEKK
ncbi:MAG TPA: YggS family pyridoxal phosphate-dependent enzyme [Bacteroidia bacterium]|jgi:pyridoxal phosphate enzyme (YggS family)|nr:YggS family pyridoxal phosphate-dependent enzyme [Bacteroidia bacterium]